MQSGKCVRCVKILALRNKILTCILCAESDKSSMKHHSTTSTGLEYDSVDAALRPSKENDHERESDGDLLSQSSFVGYDDPPTAQARKLSLDESSHTLRAPVNEENEWSAGIRVYFPGCSGDQDKWGEK